MSPRTWDDLRVDKDRDTFQALVDEHGATVLAMLRRLCRNPHDADDLFQEVAVRVWRNLGSRPILRNPRAWLLTIAYRVYIDHQAERPCYAALFDNDEALARGGSDRDPVAIAERAERAQLVNSAVAELSPPLRSVIALHYTAGLSLRQVATTMGVSVGTVKSRLSAGLEQLRRRLP
jgi:RNA polymerase sigma-70 factor, ECF subfamily